MKRILLSWILLVITSSYCKGQAPESMLDKSFGKNGKAIYFDPQLTSN